MAEQDRMVAQVGAGFKKMGRENNGAKCGDECACCRGGAVGGDLAADQRTLVVTG